MQLSRDIPAKDAPHISQIGSARPGEKVEFPVIAIPELPSRVASVVDLKLHQLPVGRRIDWIGDLHGAGTTDSM